MKHILEILDTGAEQGRQQTTSKKNVEPKDGFCSTQSWPICIPDGIDETELNDLLWFDAETVYEWLGVGDEDENENEEEEEAE